MEKEDQQLLVHRHSSKKLKQKLEFKFKYTYLVISYTLEGFKWNIFSDSWASETSVYIFFCSYNISAVRFY